MAGFVQPLLDKTMKFQGGASPMTLDPSTMTVQGRMDKLLSGDNPFVEAARTRGYQAANKRGLLNSSIGVQAGEAAALDAAGAIAAKDAENMNTLARQLMAGEQDTGLQQLRGDQAQGLANIEASYRTLMQSSSSATALFNQMQQAMNEILKNPDTSPAQKQSALDKHIQVMRSGFNVIGGIANLDLGALLDFG